MHRVSIKAVNLYKEPHDVYIGRAGKGQSGIFGNPVAIGRDCPECGLVHNDRGSTLPCYQQYLERRLKQDKTFRAAFLSLVAQAQTQGTLTLGCFCAPQPCHGDVLAAKIRQHFCKCGWHPCNPQEHAGWKPE